MSDLRIRLIERLCRLPEAHLAEVQTLLARLEENGGAIPTSDARPPTTGLPPHKDWPHAPMHRLSEHGTFIVTASTLKKEHFFRGEEKLTLLHDRLLGLAKVPDVVLEAWAVFSNHYHFVAHTSGRDNQLANFIARLHYDTAEDVNRRDGCAGRGVWFNFWETQLTYENSYFARLNYVHQNAVKHGLVRNAAEYPWCSAAWFQQMATPAQVKTIFGFRTDRVKIDDDYAPLLHTT